MTDEPGKPGEQLNPTELTQVLRAMTMMLYEKDLLTSSDQEWLFEQIDEVVDDG